MNSRRCRVRTGRRDLLIDDLLVLADVATNQPLALQATTYLIHLLARPNAGPIRQLIVIQGPRTEPQDTEHHVAMGSRDHNP